MKSKHLYRVSILYFLVLCEICYAYNQKTSIVIPNDVKYTIINSDFKPGIKRTLNIRLNKKVTKDVLKAIALKLKDSDPNQYERTFILYYLPDMNVGSGAWATTHFEPDLRINILGVTLEEEKKLLSKSSSSLKNILGVWLDEGGYSGKMTIYKENGKYYLKNDYSDGSSGVQQMLKKPSSQGQRFERIKYSQAGDYYLIDTNGNLQVRDKDGLIFIAKKFNK